MSRGSAPKFASVIVIATMCAFPTGAVATEVEEEIGLAAINPIVSDPYFTVFHVLSDRLTVGTRINLGPCDNCVAPAVALPFAFPFYGKTHTTACITSNGLILLNSCTNASANSVFGLTALSGIAVAWDDLVINGKCANDGWYRSSGQGFVSFRFSGHWVGHESCGAVNFQATLYADGDVRLDYADYKTGGVNSGVTVGVSSFSDPALWALANEPMDNRNGLFYSTDDHTPPTTTASLAGTLGHVSWYRSAVTVTLNATDNKAVASTHFTVDGGPVKTYTTPFAISGDGVHNITYFSIDKSGNLETAKKTSFKIDATPPTTVITSPTPGHIYMQGLAIAAHPLGGTTIATGSLTFTASAFDAMSGVNFISWRLDGSPVGSGSSYVFNADTAKLGTHTIGVRATDIAGNVGAFANMTFDSIPGPTPP